MSTNKAQCVNAADLKKTVERIVEAYKAQAESVVNRNPMVPEARVPRVLVAVAGRPGSGKTTSVDVLAAAVRAALSRRPDVHAPYRRVDIHDAERGEAESNPRDTYNSIDEKPAATCGVEVCVMPMDGYHLSREELAELPNPAEAVRRRGAEWTFNPIQLKRDLDAMKQFNDRGIFDDVLVPSFDHGVGDPVQRDIRIPGTAGVIIIEGNYLLYRGTPAWKAVSDSFDVKIHLSCDRDVCIKRLAHRHMKAWKISLEEAMERAMGSDTINGDLVDKTQENADLVLRSVDIPQSKL